MTMDTQANGTELLTKSYFDIVVAISVLFFCLVTFRISSLWIYLSTVFRFQHEKSLKSHIPLRYCEDLRSRGNGASQIKRLVTDQEPRSISREFGILSVIFHTETGLDT